jgi:hypothetical protein
MAALYMSPNGSSSLPGYTAKAAVNPNALSLHERTNLGGGRNPMEALHNTLGSLHLGEVQYILVNGYPPVYLQLMAANAIVFLMWLMRRIRSGRHHEGGGGHVFALLLLAANIGIVMHGQVGA